MQQNQDRITTLKPREKPSAEKLIAEIKEAITAATAMGVFDRLMRCHNVRECLWKGRGQDGRRAEGDSELPVFRWKGAPDLRIPLADGIIRWLAMLRVSVFNRGDARIGPRRVDGTGQGQADVWQLVMEYMRDVGDWNLSKSYELFSVCVEEFGYGGLLGDWQKRVRIETCELTVQQLTDRLLEQAREQMMEQALAEAEAAGAETGQAAMIDPDAVLSPEKDAELVALIKEQLNELLAPEGEIGETQLALVRAADGRLDDGEARRVIQALRRQPGQPATYYAPKDDGGHFIAKGLVPWVNFLHDPEMDGEGRCDWVATPEYLSEARVRHEALVHGWDKAAVTELLANQKNQFFSELYGGADAVKMPEWGLNGTGIGCVPDKSAMEKAPRYLVVTMYRRVTTAQGLPLIGRAVLNPHMPNHLLKWEVTDLEELPIVVDTSEAVLYAMMARGVPDIVVDKQNFVKDTYDSEGARGQLGSNPPLLRTGAQHVGIRPGIEMYAKRSGQSFDQSQFMAVPAVDQGALKMAAEAERLVNEYYCRAATSLPEDRMLFAESVGFRSLRCYKELLRLMWRTVQEKLTNLQVSRINGRDVQLDARRDQLKGEADIHIGVHLDGYSPESGERFMKMLEKLAAVDRGGILDFNEAVNMGAQLLSPMFARRLVTPAEVADGKTVSDQEMRIAKIMAGVPVTYPEKVSNPRLRMQVLEQWAAMPGNIERVQAGDPLILEMMQKERESLEFLTTQQEVNPLIGRTGVKANEPEAAA